MLKKRILALLLTVTVMLTQSVALEMTGEDGVGLFARQNELTIADGTDLHINSLQHTTAGKNEERYIEYTPGSEVTPIVSYGSVLYGKSTINYVSNYIESQGNTVVAGVNGDFFMMDTGIPIGIVVTDGILRSSDVGGNAVGIYSDGSAFIGKPGLKVQLLTDSGYSLKIDYVNKNRKNYGVYLLTPDFSGNTRATTEGTTILLSNLSGDLKVGGSITATVSNIIKGSTPINLPKGTFALTATEENGLAGRLDAIGPNQQVTISVSTADERFNNVAYAVGAGDKLVTAGTALTGLTATAAPRTAVGITAEGKLLFYTVDGRQSGYSDGMDLNELASRMASLGCVEAVNLDGGGSTVMVSQYPGFDTLDTINSPSDGKQRMCANYILFVNRAEKTEIPSNIYLYPFNPFVLAGSNVQFSAKATDFGYYPAPTNNDLAFSVDSPLGYIDNEGLFTAGTEEGVLSATVSGSSLINQTRITICKTPSSIVLSNAVSKIPVNSLALNLNETVDLNAACYYSGIKLYSNDTALRWQIVNQIGEIGTVDATGVFTASDKPGSSGILTVTAGEKSMQIPISIGSGDRLIDTFEGVSSGLTPGGDFIHSTIESNKNYVKYGNSAGKIVYDFNGIADEALMLTTSWQIPKNSRYLKFWLYGDQSGNTFGLSLKASDGTITYLPVCTLDFLGYTALSIELPTNVSQISALYIRKETEAPPTGMVFIDQMTASYNLEMDQSAPKIEIITADSTSLEGTLRITARIVDNGYIPVVKQNIAVMLDGVACTFAYMETKAELTADIPIPQAGGLHRLTIKATDVSGNMASLSNDFETDPSDPSVFIDTSGHWSEKYANYLNARGVITGTLKEDGRYFNPNAMMTRAEFAVVMTNYLGLNPVNYAEVELPYIDADQIPQWARNPIAAMFANGVIMGKSTESGLVFDPFAPVKRAEVMTILGRTLPKGLQSGEIMFTDSEGIPAYAVGYVSILVNLNVINGYSDSTIRPNNNVYRSEAAKMVFGMY